MKEIIYDHNGTEKTVHCHRYTITDGFVNALKSQEQVRIPIDRVIRINQ